MQFAKFCFKGNKNHIILEASCSLKDEILVNFVYLFCFFYSVIMNFIIQIFYNDFLHLLNSYLSKSSSSILRKKKVKIHISFDCFYGQLVLQFIYTKSAETILL